MDDSQSARHGLSAAILTGGASRRMGTDKALLTIAGQTLLERAIGAVTTVADDVMIVGEREAYYRFGVPVVPDRVAGAGALGGIVSGLHRARHEFMLVVACDMPFVSPVLLAAMAGQPREYDVLVPVMIAVGNDRSERRTYETLHAIYRRRCIQPFERRIANGELRVAAALADVDVRELSDEWLRRQDPSLDSFVNTNDPVEWSAAVARLGI